MIRISATEFKAKCLAIIDEVGTTGDIVVIEKRGKPVAQLSSFVPLDAEVPQASLRGTVRIVGDVTEPVVDPDDWSVLRGDT